MVIYLSKRTLCAMRVHFLFFWLIALLICAASKAVIILCILAAAGLLFAFFYLPALISNYEITLNNDCISVKRGVIFKRLSVLPDKRLIYFKQYRTPVLRLFKLCAVKLEITGRGIFIPALDMSDAVKLENYIHNHIRSK